MKRLVLSSLVISLLLMTIFVVGAKAGLVTGSSEGQSIALDSDPSELMPEAGLFQQQPFIYINTDPNEPEPE